MIRRRVETGAIRLPRLWLHALVVLILLFLVAPTLLVIPMSFSVSRFLAFPPPAWSFRWYRAYFESIEWCEATRISFTAAGGTMIVATILGTAAAYGIHNSRLLGARRFVQVILLLPMIVPVILIAVGDFIFFAQVGLNNTILGLILAHSALAIPLVLISVTAGLRSFDDNQEIAARSLGAHRFAAFITVTLPQIRYSVISGALLAFVTSLDEVVIALFIASGDSATLTRRMFLALRDEIDPTIAAISTMLIVLSVALIGISQIFQKRRRAI